VSCGSDGRIFEPGASRDVPARRGNNGPHDGLTAAVAGRQGHPALAGRRADRHPASGGSGLKSWLPINHNLPQNTGTVWDPEASSRAAVGRNRRTVVGPGGVSRVRAVSGRESAGSGGSWGVVAVLAAVGGVVGESSAVAGESWTKTRSR
jgi:hypothetical protein